MHESFACLWVHVCVRASVLRIRICSHAYTWRHIQVSVQLYVWTVRWILTGCACISMTMCTDRQTCVPLWVSMCLCVQVCVCGPPCLAIHLCRTPCMGICMYASAYICLSFCSHLFVILYGCGLCASVHMSASP